MFTMDACYTFNISAKIREFANEQQIVVRYEHLKAQIQKKNEELKEKRHFLFQFRTEHLSLHDSMKEIFKRK